MSEAEENNPENAAAGEEDDEDPDAGVLDEQRAIEESIRLAQQLQQDEEAQFAKMVEDAMRLSEISAKEEEMSREYNELREKSEKYKDLTYRVEREVTAQEDKGSLNERAIAMSEVIEDGPPKVYKLTGIPVGGNDKRHVRRLAYGPPNKGVLEKTILIVGETGSGKSTLIDSLVNYIMGGKSPEDPYRFRIIDVKDDEKKDDPAVSQTDWITCYSVNKMRDSPVNFNLNIIDTPGFGDTRGIERDRGIVHQIRDLFESMGDYGLQCLDAVCIVIKSSTNRLTATQKYIFDSLMALFGKDIGENIIALCTFCDSSASDAIESFKGTVIPYQDLFTFNNVALFKKSSFTQIYWDMMMENWLRFFDKLDIYESRSLNLSVDVLNERQVLQDRVALLMPLIHEGLHKMYNNKSFVEKSGNNLDSISIDYKSCTRERKQCSHICTNCTKCEQTCVCRGLIMKSGENCPLCECPENLHEKEECKWENNVTIKRMSLLGLKSKYKVQSSQALGKALNDEYADIKLKVESNIKAAQQSTNRLEEIALRPKNQSVVEYIDLLIVSEKNNPNDGRVERIVELQQLKKQYEKQHDISTGGFDWQEQASG